MNLLQPLQEVTGIKYVHIVSTDEDHFPYLRYLEKSMMGQNKGFVKQSISTYQLQLAYLDVKDKTKQAKVGNELARILQVKPCYPVEATTGAC